MLSDFFEGFVRQTVTRVPNSLGGYVETLTDGAAFSAGIFTGQHGEVQIAGQPGAKTTYTIIHPPELSFVRGDVVKRVSDGRLYRITSNSADMRTPAVAAVQYACVTAEVIEP